MTPPRARRLPISRRWWVCCVVALATTGCTATGAATPQAADPVPEPPATGSATPAATPIRPAGDPRATPTLAATHLVAEDRRTGAELDAPFAVSGTVVVSKDHRISATHVPSWSTEPHGIHPEARQAFGRMAQAAAEDGRILKIRSGYRSFAAQKISFERALRTYDDAVARRYFAEPGASEHQTGLAVDAWDGVNRGAAFTATHEAQWLASRAHEFGFIIRYPQGKTAITGVAHESWHLRWVGPEIAADFGPNSTLTLEEYLGLVQR
ncbi:MAG: D-alanyl-D-alanine carboxypeptidase family protein [Propioniciclava sp.]